MPPEDRPIAADVSPDKSMGEIVTTISEQASVLVREEIELAKTEVELKVKRLGTGAAVAAAAGFFVFLALILAFIGLAWALNDLLESLWLGFLIVTILLLVLAGIAGFVASRAFKAGAPPTPDQAIQEARLIRETLEHGIAGEHATDASGVEAPSGAAANNR